VVREKLSSSFFFFWKANEVVGGIVTAFRVRGLIAFFKIKSKFCFSSNDISSAM
jgi:hypothetical protein